MQRPKTLKDAWVLIEQLIEIDRQLRLDNERLRKRVDELKRQLKTNSRNSSKPPSTDQKCKPYLSYALRPARIYRNNDALPYEVHGLEVGLPTRKAVLPDCYAISSDPQDFIKDYYDKCFTKFEKTGDILRPNPTC